MCNWRMSRRSRLSKLPRHRLKEHLRRYNALFMQNTHNSSGPRREAPDHGSPASGPTVAPRHSAVQRSFSTHASTPTEKRP